MIAAAKTSIHPEVVGPVELGIILMLSENITKLSIVLTLIQVQLKLLLQ